MSLLSPFITASGWIYGRSSIHDDSRSVRGYPMYYPSVNGDRVFRGQRYMKYTRLSQLEKRVIQPYRLAPMLDPWSVTVPCADIIEYVDCHRSFWEWRRTEDVRKEIVDTLFRRAGIPLQVVGLTGSLALDCPGDNPDLDLLVCGSQWVVPCIRELEKMLHRQEVSLMSIDVAHRYAQRYADLYQLPEETLFHLFHLDPTKIYIHGVKISIIFVYDTCEYKKIPTSLYREGGAEEVSVQGRVVSSLASWLYPREYLVMCDGELYSVWSHHWLYKSMASSGAEVSIVARQVGERVFSISALHHHILSATLH